MHASQVSPESISNGLTLIVNRDGGNFEIKTISGSISDL